MYVLMNKNNPVLIFRPVHKPEMAEDVSFETVQTYTNAKTPFGFWDITSWIESRKASKHNAHLKAIMRNLGCDDNEGFIRLTHAVGINDTFWIKNEKESVTWEDVSLYRNPFSDVISRLSFEGVGLYNEIMSSTSPELSCEGSFRKCFRKEKTPGEYGSDIFLYKRGGEIGTGIEPYCEVLSSELAKIVSPSSQSVKYELSKLHGKTASKCNIFTNETTGYASYSKISADKSHSLDNTFRFFEKLGCEQQFREMLIIDSLCFNQDRHSGNYGILFQNDTMRILGMAPTFDLNLTLLPYASLDEFDHIGDRLYNCFPKLGNDFTRIGQIAMNDTIRDRLKDIKNFSFAFRGDDVFSKERIKAVEELVQQQALAILSKETLQTKDVFFSKEAFLAEKQRARAKYASASLEEFCELVDGLNLSPDSQISVCDDEKCVSLYLENESYLFVIDFLTNTYFLQQNACPFDLPDLKLAAPSFYKDVAAVITEFADFLMEKEKKCPEVDNPDSRG